MVKIIIDTTECDFDASLDISLSYSSGDLVDLESGRTGQTIKFKLPATPTNSAIFGIGGDTHPQTKFNTVWHEMRVEVDGITLFSGTAYLMQEVWESDQSRYFVVECRGGVLSWASSASATLFKNIGISYSNTLTESNIKASWESDSPVKFFPIVRDSYDDEGSSVDVTGVRLLRSTDDYHPFIQVSALVEAIFSDSGYTVESQTAATELFDELYISGSYSSAENSAARSAMGFYVKRADDGATTTDYNGRVSLSPHDQLSTVGNLADLETTLTDSECYNYGNVLQMDSQALMFVPLTQISMGFEYYLHYTCVCQILSRSQLKGIDTLNTVDNGEIKWEITNRHIDQRDNIATGVLYRLMIFDYEQGDTYRLLGVSSTGSTEVIAVVGSRFTDIEFTQTYDSYQLQKYLTTGYLTTDEDWALYFGYVEEYSPTEIKITVRSSPSTYSPTSPKYFELQRLEGGVGATDFTLHAGTSIRPYFSEYPGYNSSITFEDIAQQSFYALDLLTSLQHLFNLRFSTNEESKVVTIESFDLFYNGEECDWSDKVIQGEQIEFVDLAHEGYRTNTYGYQQSDGVVSRMGDDYGQWSFTVDSYAASSTSNTSLNPVLSASTNDDDGVLAVGDRDDTTTVDSLSFSPRIARYFRLMEIEGENYSLPYVAFHSPDDGFTLCFEDRDDTEGLNRLYQSYVELLRRAQVVTLSLKLSALEYSNLFVPNDQSPSLRSIFCFELQGESFRTILHSITSYDPQSGVARCSFLTID